MRCHSCGAKPLEPHAENCDEVLEEHQDDVRRSPESLFDDYWKLQDRENRK